MLNAGISFYSNLPGLSIDRLIADGSLRDHFCISSSILEILVGFIVHKHPFRGAPVLPIGFSIFSKHLFKLRL